jgi:hypothetical protein
MEPGIAVHQLSNFVFGVGCMSKLLERGALSRVSPQPHDVFGPLLPFHGGVISEAVPSWRHWSLQHVDVLLLTKVLQYFWPYRHADLS